MSTHDLSAILRSLQSTQFRDLSGARLSAAIPVSERLINELIAATLPPNAPVREAHVHPEAGDRFSVRVSPRMALLPSLTVKLQIERQPELPASPVLTLRMATLGGLFGMVSAALGSGQLPPGVRMDGEFIHVDLRAMAAQRGFADLFQYVRQLRVTTGEGHAVIHADLGI